MKLFRRHSLLLCFPHRRKYGRGIFFRRRGATGSAGRPILGAIRRGDFTDTMVVVVRFFGGKKLGIRGLIDAYGKTAQLVLEKSGKKAYREIEFLVKIDPVYFSLVVNQLVEVVQDKQLLSIYPDREVHLRISQSEEEKNKRNS